MFSHPNSVLSDTVHICGHATDGCVAVLATRTTQNPAAELSDDVASLQNPAWLRKATSTHCGIRSTRLSLEIGSPPPRWCGPMLPSTWHVDANGSATSIPASDAVTAIRLKSTAERTRHADWLDGDAGQPGPLRIVCDVKPIVAETPSTQPSTADQSGLRVDVKGDFAELHSHPNGDCVYARRCVYVRTQQSTTLIPSKVSISFIVSRAGA